MKVSKSNCNNSLYNFELSDISFSFHPIDILLLFLVFMSVIQFYIFPFFSNSSDLFRYGGWLDIGLIYSYIMHSSIDHFIINFKWLLAYRLFFTWKKNFRLHTFSEVVSFTVIVGILTNLLVFIVTLFLIGSFTPVTGFSGVLFGLFGFQTAAVIKRSYNSQFSLFQYILLLVGVSAVWIPLYYMISSGVFDISIVGHVVGYVIGFVYFYIF